MPNSNCLDLIEVELEQKSYYFLCWTPLNIACVLLSDGAVIQTKGLATLMKSKLTPFSMMLTGKTSGRVIHLISERYFSLRLFSFGGWKDYRVKTLLHVEFSFIYFASLVGKDLLPFQFMLNLSMTLQTLTIFLNQSWIQVSIWIKNNYFHFQLKNKYNP